MTTAADKAQLQSRVCTTHLTNMTPAAWALLLISRVKKAMQSWGKRSKFWKTLTTVVRWGLIL